MCRKGKDSVNPANQRKQTRGQEVFFFSQDDSAENGRRMGEEEDEEHCPQGHNELVIFAKLQEEQNLNCSTKREGNETLPSPKWIRDAFLRVRKVTRCVCRTQISRCCPAAARALEPGEGRASDGRTGRQLI